MQMARQLHLVSREDEIVALALNLFSRSGYRETSLQEVADRLGLTRQAFYYYFKSKDELLWRLIGHLGDQLLDKAKPIAGSDADSISKLRQLIEAHVHTIGSNADAFRIYFAERHLVSKGRNHRLKGGEDTYLDLVAAVIESGQRRRAIKSGSPRLLGLLAIGIANSILRWYNPRGEIGLADIARLVADVAVDGLRA
jgi:AcrR family transcriptional regulator